MIETDEQNTHLEENKEVWIVKETYLSQPEDAHLSLRQVVWWMTAFVLKGLDPLKVVDLIDKITIIHINRSLRKEA